jgi:hypothetical protein
MKNKINIKSLVFGAVLGAVVLFSVGADRSGESSQAKAWDYKILQGYVSGDLEKRLKLAGDEGWAVASSTSPDGSSGMVLVILKRDK